MEENGMKRMKLVCSLVVFALIFNILALPGGSIKVAAESEFPAQITEAGADTASQVNQTAQYISTDNETYTEIHDKRTADTKTFLLASKRYEAVLFALPVHYLAADGQYQPIDNSLFTTTSADGTVCYRNRANSFTAELATQPSSSWLANVAKDGFSLKWSMSGLSSQESAEMSSSLTTAEWERLGKGDQRRSVPNLSSQVLYRDVLSGIDLQLNVVSDQVKENFILNEKTNVSQISQTLTVEGLTLTLEDDGSITAISDENSKTPVFWLPKPYAVDSSSEITYLPVSLKETTPSGQDGDVKTRTYELTYTLDQEWFDKASYPVRIDPTVWTTLNSQDIRDARVCDNYPDTNYSGVEFFATGYGSSSHVNYSLVRFMDMPVLETASMIQHAGLKVFKKSTSSVTSQVSVHQITQDWTSNTVTWNNKPTFDSQVDDVQLVDLPANEYYIWDITRIAKAWYTGTPDYGVLLKDMSDSGGYKEWWSSNAIYYQQYLPSIYIVYTNYSGLESCWDYSTTSLGRSGSASVNLYNGNLVYTHTDLAMNGNRLPVTISSVFNSTTKDDNDSKVLCGKGWRTNYDQRVSYVTIGGTNYYKYTDGDGTIHYFYNESGNTWKDESGLDLTMTIASNVPTITDTKDNKLVFYATNDANKPGFLNRIEDRNGNQQTVGYDATTYRINQITDGAGRVVWLERDANGYLYRIKQLVGDTPTLTYRYTTFAYTNSRLTSITYPDNETTYFTYDGNGNIDYVSGIANDKLDLTYSPSSPYRVITVEKSATVSGTTTYGQHTHFAYGYNRTTVEDSEGRQATYQFNDMANTVCLIGPDGGASYAGYGTTATSGDMSKVTTASKFQKFGKNLIPNHNAELSTSWSLSSQSGSTGTHAYATDQKYLGAQSIKLVKTNTSGYEMAGQTMSLVKGQTYTFSGYIKTDNVSSSSGGVYLQATYYDSAGAGHSVRSTYLTGTNEWQRYSLSFTVPADASTATVYIYCLLIYSTGTSWFDCLQLEEGSVP
jgi:hypothetical protein